jgi:demethylmenaquinone methyltransferase/2-methoxy-6-polyprenyl-1,4-benzoquinol methylase
MKPFNHFDFLAPFYDRFLKPDNPGRFSELLKLPASGLLLDAAGGTGGKSHALLGIVSGIVVVDSSMGMLTEAGKKDGLMTACTETEHLPFEDGTFVRIIMVDALHHVADFRLTLKELWRMLKPGGCIVVEEPDIRTFPVKVMALVEKLALMRSHFISPQDIAAAFNNPNAEVKIEIENSTAWIVVKKSE